jgi:hypothetical protein
LLRLSIQTLLMRILLLFYNPNLQIITLQCVRGQKQKTLLQKIPSPQIARISAKIFKSTSTPAKKPKF